MTPSRRTSAPAHRPTGVPAYRRTGAPTSCSAPFSRLTAIGLRLPAIGSLRRAAAASSRADRRAAPGSRQPPPADPGRRSPGVPRPPRWPTPTPSGRPDCGSAAWRAPQFHQVDLAGHQLVLGEDAPRLGKWEQGAPGPLEPEQRHLSAHRVPDDITATAAELTAEAVQLPLDLGVEANRDLEALCTGQWALRPACSRTAHTCSRVTPANHSTNCWQEDQSISSAFPSTAALRAHGQLHAH
jgi:hypothetical protein